MFDKAVEHLEMFILWGNLNRGVWTGVRDRDWFRRRVVLFVNKLRRLQSLYDQ